MTLKQLIIELNRKVITTEDFSKVNLVVVNGDGDLISVDKVIVSNKPDEATAYLYVK